MKWRDHLRIKVYSYSLCDQDLQRSLPVNTIARAHYFNTCYLRVLTVMEVTRDAYIKALCDKVEWLKDTKAESDNLFAGKRLFAP